MKNYNYVAPYQERFLFSEQQKQRAEAARQQANQAVLQQQAVKRQKQDAVDYSSIYGFDTTGWSTDYMDLFKQAQDHVAGKLRSNQYQPGGLDSDVQSLINIHKTIKNMWDLSASSMAQYVNVMQDPNSHETNEMEIVETPEMLKNKLDYAVNWGMQNSYFNPDEMAVYGRFVGPDGSLLNEGNWMPLDQHPYITAEFWNPQMQLRAEETPIDYVQKMQATLTGLLEDNVSVPEAKKRIIDAIKSDVVNTRNHIAYGQRNGLVEVEGKKYEDWFAEDTWRLLSKALGLDTGTSSGSGDDEGLLDPSYIMVYPDPTNNRVVMKGSSFPIERDLAVNFGTWFAKNLDIIQVAFQEVGLTPDDVDGALLPETISYSDGKFTVEGPRTPSGNIVPGLNITLDPNIVDDKAILDEIERRYRDIYRISCSLEEIVTESCSDLNESVIEDEVDWGGL